MAQVRSGLAKHGDGFFAMAQVKGKGQRGKTWITEPGANIILTLVLQPSPLALTQQFIFSAAIALAVRDFFSFYAGEETSIKWPNDIYWRDRKAGGILIENIVGSRSGVDGRESGVDSGGHTLPANPDENPGAAEEPAPHASPLPPQHSPLPTIDSRPSTRDYRLQTTWTWAIVGMGININQTVFAEAVRQPVSLKQITGRHWDVIALARELSHHVQRRYEQLLSGEDLLPAYNEQLYKRGQTVRFKKGSRVFEATVKGVNEKGDLVAQTATEELFGFGEVEWVISS